VFLLVGVVATAAFAGGGQDDTADGEITVTLGYNSFLSGTSADMPAPIDVMRAALENAYPNITLEYETMSRRLLDQLVIWMTSQDTRVDISGIDDMVRIIETVQAAEPDTAGLIWPGREKRAW
jgi:ABC-type glycerol-3-phosphate transport system substrate-binding protein